MARTGYLAGGAALMRLALITGDSREASRLLADAMVRGVILARGRPLLEPEVDESGPMILRDLNSQPPADLGDVEDIPSTFWKNAEPHERSRWDFEQGFALSADRHSAATAYGDIKLREKDVNAIVDVHRTRLAEPSSGPTKPRERLRDPSWEEWIAALASLAHEHSITPELKQTDLLDLIDHRLARWGLAPKDRSTVSPTARKVLERFRTSPPADPLSGGGIKSQKP